jgi:hypothetical protein
VEAGRESVEVGIKGWVRYGRSESRDGSGMGVQSRMELDFGGGERGAKDEGMGPWKGMGARGGLGVWRGRP